METCHTIVEQILRRGEDAPERRALVDRGEAISYGALCARARDLALELLRAGVRRGDRVAYALRPSPAFFSTYLAAGMIGAAAAGVAYHSPPEAAAVILRELNAKAVVCDDSLTAAWRQFAGEGVAVIPAGAAGAAADRSLLPLLEKLRGEVRPEDPFLILYTSGTTRRPKGAVLTHKNVMASVRMQNTHLFATGFTEEDVAQHCFPVNHVSGAVESGIAPLAAGGTLVLLPEFRPQAVLEDVERYRVTVMSGVPAMWTMLLACMRELRCDLSSVRSILSGASPLSPAAAEQLLQICNVCENPLGMTETSGFCTCFPRTADAERLWTTVGRIMPELRCKIADANGDPVRPGEIGQLCYQGDSVIGGYVSEPLPVDAEGYFLTGDMAFAEPDGTLHLCGRNDDLFTVGGYNVSPQEIEEVLLRYPGITGAAVLPVPHHSMGSVCRAYLTADRAVDTADVERYAERELIYYKVPRDYVIRDRLPVNGLGKLSRAALMKEIEEEFRGR